MHLGLQTRQIYKILIEKNGPLTAGELALKIGVSATDIYRLAKTLLDIGLIEKIKGRPVKFQAKPVSEGSGLFLLNESRWFGDQFGSGIREKESSDMQFDFVQSRDELMKKSATEIDESKISVDLLRSGHEIPGETMRAMVAAIHRGVKIRMLIQDYDSENEEQVGNWVRNGICVRVTDLKHLRLMIYDSKVCYFMSYKHSESGQDQGMKIVYPPFAAILLQYFDELWEKGKKIS